MIMRRFLIWLIHQHFLCHGGWTLRTPPITPGSHLPVVSSSEATLLTSSRMFTSSMQRLLGSTENDYDAAYNEINKSVKVNIPKPIYRVPKAMGKPPTPKTKNKIISVKTNCTRDLFDMRIDLSRNFRGILYAKDFPFECRSRGSDNTNVTLKLPTSGCGVRSEAHSDGNLEFSVKVMLQMDEKLRQSTDILRTIRCVLPQMALGMTVLPTGEIRKTFRNGRMHSGNEDGDSLASAQISSMRSAVNTKSTPRVRIWLELGGPDGSGAVEVGQATTLTVRAIVPGNMGVRVVDCAALDGLGESTQQLLDQRGCPIDEQVMPALHTRFRRTNKNWTKFNEDDLVEKLFTATFAAFKFPDRERLHVSCGVQLCKGNCPNVNCRTGELLILTSDKHLARIEVFNSLAVTAPQIEVDQLRYDRRRYNMSVEEYPPRVRQIQSEGTLCLSVSKLAISFCLLGLIFLVAIIVSICCLIRSRRRHNCSGGSRTTTGAGSRRHRGDITTSIFSSSSDSAHSARFGSKLFIPYYPATLPYGRVY